MRSKIIRLFAHLLLILTFIALSPPLTLALDPSVETQSCFNNESGVSPDGVPCEVVNCEWRNTANNWPDDTGYRENCETGEVSADNLLFYTGIGVIGVMVGAVLYSFRHWKRKTKK